MLKTKEVLLNEIIQIGYTTTTMNDILQWEYWLDRVNVSLVCRRGKFDFALFPKAFLVNVNDLINVLLNCLVSSLRHF